MINFSIVEDEDLNFAFEFGVLINEKYEYGIEADTEEDALAVVREFFTDDYPEVEITKIEITDVTEI